MTGWRSIIMFILGVLMPMVLFASHFSLPKIGDDIIGEVRSTVAEKNDNFVKIAYRSDVSYCELVEANPSINPEKPPVGTVLIIPSQYILPNTPREGVVVNLAEMRLYYFPPDKEEVWTYPVGIGREGETTPEGYMLITRHEEKPVWHPPEQFRKLKAKEGVTFPKEVPAGPDNPLGDYSMRLSTYPYLIHGTNDNSGVGRRSSAGCIRMYNRDIKEVFDHANDETLVVVVSEPLKWGRHKGRLYLEAHMPLQEHRDRYKDLEKSAHEAMHWLSDRHHQNVHWRTLLAIAKESQGVPQVIGLLGARLDPNNRPQ